MIFIMTPHDITLKLQRAERFWAIKSKVRLPADAVERIEYDLKKPNMKGRWKYFRFGTGMPWVLLAGTFTKNDTREFWYLRNKPGVLTITLKKDHAKYDKVSVTVRPTVAAEVMTWWDGR